MCFFTGLLLPNKEHSHRIPQLQCNLIQLPMRNKIRLKAGKRKYLPFANPSSAGERRASHVLLHSRDSDYLLITLPKILLPTALCNAAYKSGSNLGCTVDFSSERTELNTWLCYVQCSCYCQCASKCHCFFWEYTMSENHLG